MSNVGGANNVTGATLVFRQGFSNLPPSADPITSFATSYYKPSNYGAVTLPQIGIDPPPSASAYQANLDTLIGEDPNGCWKLYIYDGTQPGGVGLLGGSWNVRFAFQ